jgi:hypothetical protein
VANLSSRREHNANQDAYLVRALCLLALLAGLSGLAPAGPAHAEASPDKEVAPLADLLNPDGSLDLSTGFQGTLGARGWRMTYAEDGAPLFEPAPEAASPQSSADTWNPLGDGLNDTVMAIAVAGPDVYVGDLFTNAGGIEEADYIARWDSTSWHALGTPLNGTVAEVTVVGPDVYAAGQFHDAGGSPHADGIARWGGGYRVYLPLILR